MRRVLVDEHFDVETSVLCDRAVEHRRVEVIDVLDRWLAPEQRYFKLRGDDDGVYILCHDVVRDHWELRLFDAGRSESTRLSST